MRNLTKNSQRAKPRTASGGNTSPAAPVEAVTKEETTVLTLEPPTPAEESVKQEFHTDDPCVAAFVFANIAFDRTGNAAFLGVAKEYTDKDGSMWSASEQQGQTVIICDVEYERYTRAVALKRTAENRLADTINDYRSAAKRHADNEEKFTRASQSALAGNHDLPAGIEEDYTNVKKTVRDTMDSKALAQERIKEEIAELDAIIAKRVVVRYTFDNTWVLEILAKCLSTS